MIFVQFLGVIKCLNNPYFPMCRLAHTKNPHIKNFGASDLFVTTIGGVHPNPKPFVRFNLLQGSINPSKAICLFRFLKTLFRVERIYALYHKITLTTK